MQILLRFASVFRILFFLRKSDVSVVSGHRSRSKTVQVDAAKVEAAGLSAEDILEKLRAAATEGE
jgi:uncharacterized protein YggU (UPF0235/DUF167 family)